MMRSGRWHSWDGTGALIKETAGSPSPLPPWEDAGRGLPSVYNLETVLTMTAPSLRAPGAGTSSLQMVRDDCLLFVSTLCAVAFCDSSPTRPRYAI